MLKTICEVGDSLALIFDDALCELAGIKAGDQLNVTVHEGGAITLMPTRPRISAKKAASAAKELIERNAEVFKRLA